MPAVEAALPGACDAWQPVCRLQGGKGGGPTAAAEIGLYRFRPNLLGIIRGTDMEPDDGLIWIYGLDDETMAFTDFGIGNLKYLVRNPQRPELSGCAMPRHP